MVRAAWAFVVLTFVATAFAGLGAVMSFRRGDPDAWIALPILIAVGLLPLGFLWLVLRAMRAANRNASSTEQTIAAFSTLESLKIPGASDEEP